MEKEKQADTSKHNAFEGAPVQIRSSTVKHKDWPEQSWIQISVFGTVQTQDSTILDFVQCKEADNQVHMGIKVPG